MATNIPANLKYTKEHEWVLVEGDTATIGITDFAQSALGDIVFLEVPAVGTQLNAGSTFGVVESIKSVSDLYAPVSGEIIARNDNVESTPEKINENAFEAWLIKVKINNPEEIASLLTAQAYDAFCQTSA